MSSEILNLNALTWSNGPAFDNSYSFMESVPYRDSFLLVGGRTGGESYLKTIHEYDASKEDWVLRSESLGEEKEATTAIMVDFNVVDCTSAK